MSANKLRPKAGKIMVVMCGCRGIAFWRRHGGKCGRPRINAARGFSGLCGMARAKRSPFADLIFASFDQAKEESLAALERHASYN